MFKVTTAGVIVVAIGTAISAGGIWATYGQMKAANEQVAIMQQQVRDAEMAGFQADEAADEALARQDQMVSASNRAANASQKQVETAQDTARRQLRAYVHVTPRPPTGLVAGESPRRGIEYNVLGQTPAYDAQVRMRIMLGPYPMPVDITRYYLRKPYQPVNKAAIFPGDKLWAMDSLTCVSAAGTIITDCKLSQESLDALAKDKTVRLYVFGMVKYRDAFQRVHHIPFCFSRDPNGTDHQICPKVGAPD